VSRVCHIIEQHAFAFVGQTGKDAELRLVHALPVLELLDAATRQYAEFIDVPLANEHLDRGEHWRIVVASQWPTSPRMA
jgi:hypothetical protein